MEQLQSLKDLLGNTISKEIFWSVQTNIKTFPFLYKEYQK